MLDVLSITLPIFCLIALGYASTRFAVTSRADIAALGQFVIRFALPALIFRSLYQRSPGEIVNWDYLLALSLASLFVFAVAFAAARVFAGASVTASAIQALGSSLSNSGFIGYPIVSLFLGPTIGAALALQMIVENAVIFPLALVLAEFGEHKGKGIGSILVHLAGRLAKNPLIIAILCGLGAALTGLKPPVALSRTIDLLAGASGAVALFVVGGALFGLRLMGMVGDISRIVAGKLILHPLAVVAALKLTPALDGDMKKAMLIFAAAPVFTIFPLIGRPYGQEQIGAAVLMTATVLSFFTISALLVFLGP